MSVDRLLVGTVAYRLERYPTDVTACPSPGVSLIAESDWLAMIATAGSESALLAALGVTYGDG